MTGEKQLMQTLERTYRETLEIMQFARAKSHDSLGTEVRNIGQKGKKKIHKCKIIQEENENSRYTCS